jgi:hypothetical protein
MNVLLQTFNAPWWGSAQWQKGNRPIIESDLRGEQPELREVFQARGISDAGGKDARLLPDADFWRTRGVACWMSVTNWQDGSVVSIATVVTAPTVPILSRMLEWWCLRV